MDLRQWLFLIVCAASLALGVVAIARVRQATLAAPLAAVCLLGFAWRFSVWAFSLTDAVTWLYLERITLAWSPAVGLSFTFAFLGLRQRLRLVLALSYGLDAALSAVVLLGLFFAPARPIAESIGWERVLCVHMLVSAGASALLLLRHLRTCASPEENVRTRIMLAACALVLVLPALNLFAPEAVALSSLVLSCALALLTIVSFGFRLFDSALGGLGAVYVVALVGGAGGGYLVASPALGSSVRLLLLAALVLAPCLLVLLAQAIMALLEQRARARELATLGRWSAYMTHDLKSPLASVKGAAQFLAQELAQGHSLDHQHEFIALLVSESDRLSRLLDHYQRFGALGAQREHICLNGLLRSLLARAELVPRALMVRAELEASLPCCLADRALLAVALENLLRNSVEAMPDGGTLILRTQRAQRRFARAVVAISIEDTGHGMNPRQAERACDDFFSTKRGRRGLGLSLVKRAMEAHRGSVRISSRLGLGTRVVLNLPVA
jgi:signal transduction histidine kinase